MKTTIGKVVGEKLPIRPEVLAFALLMEEKLKQNDHKRSWKEKSTFVERARSAGDFEQEEIPMENWLYQCLLDEMEELKKSKDPKELIDIANFCMMLHDKLKPLNTEVEIDVGAIDEILRNHATSFPQKVSEAIATLIAEGGVFK